MPRIRPLRNQEDDKPPVLATPPDPAPTEDVTYDIEGGGPAIEPATIDLAPEVPEKPQAAPAVTAPSPEPSQEDALKRALEATQRADALQRQLAEETRRRQQHEQELLRERGDREDAQYNSVLTAIAAEESALEKAESDYAAFAAAGDWANAAKAQRAMATAGARIDRLEDNKQAFESRREEAKRQPPAPKEDPLPPRAHQWLAAHPEFNGDRARIEQLGVTHQYLTKQKNLTAFSDAYFDALDAEFGFRKPAPQATEPEPAPVPAPKRSMPVSAPVSRDVPNASGQRRPSQITLTPEQREIARNSFGSARGVADMTNEQKERLYAENLAKLQRMRASGEYRHTTEQTG